MSKRPYTPFYRTEDERLEIGREIYDGELTRYEAAKIYEISVDTARTYMRMYRDFNQLPPKNASEKEKEKAKIRRKKLTAKADVVVSRNTRY